MQKIVAQERIDFGDSKIPLIVNQTGGGKKVAHRKVHKQCATMDMPATMPCVALGQNFSGPDPDAVL